MNKRNAVFMTILTFLSPAMTWAMNNDQWQNSEAADQLAAIYQADQLGQLHMLSNLQSSIIILQNHIKSLESQKSNYSGIFGGKIGTVLTKALSAFWGINSIIRGLSIGGAIRISKAYKYQTQDLTGAWNDPNTITASEYNKIGEWFKNEANKLSYPEYESLQTEIANAIIVEPLCALAAGGLFWYSSSKYDAVQKDKRLNAQIKRDQEIIEKLQVIQADRVFYTYQTN